MIAGFGRDVRSWSNLPWYIRTWNNPTKVDPDGMFQVQVGEWITGFFGKSAHKIPFGKSSSHRACYKPFQKNELDLEILGKLWMGQRNPAPVDRWFIPLFIGFQPTNVVQDFATIRNMISLSKLLFRWSHPTGAPSFLFWGQVRTGNATVANVAYPLEETAPCWNITGWWFQPSEIYWSVGIIIPNIWKNKECSKPSTRSDFLLCCFI